MTVTNYTSDGQYPTLIVLCRVLAGQGPMAKEELVRVCAASEPKFVRSTLSTWISMGLFTETGDDRIAIQSGFGKGRGETLDQLTARIPSICRRLMFDSAHALPMWRADGKLLDEGIGTSADFVRQLAWALAQDIYELTFDTGGDAAVALTNTQATAGKHILLNPTRWSGLSFWARFTGFASGDGHGIDPTEAIRAELPAIFQGSKVLLAGEFLRELSARLPVLDFGRYRVEVESALKDTAWRRPPNGHLSMSLSLALRRLQLDQTIALDALADAPETYSLSGRQFRQWLAFSQIELRS
jgi:hypothetical protein